MLDSLKIDLDEEPSLEESYEKFVTIIGQALDSYDREKYGSQIFYEVVKVACKNIEELIVQDETHTGDCVITSAYIPDFETPVMRDSEAYDALVQKVQRSYEKYQTNVIGQRTLYHSVNDSCVLVDEILEANAKKQAHSYQKVLKAN